MKIAFYAPLKSPDHPTPSGDRQMARALIKALRYAGHDVEVVSHLRGFSKTPHSLDFKQEFKNETKRVIETLKPWQPDVWFSYHPYYKSPDFLALDVCAALAIPMVTAEASIAVKRDDTDWNASQAIVRKIVSKSSCNFYFTDRDKDGLLSETASKNLVYLPPFVDTKRMKKTLLANANDETVRFVTMGMMRGGVKTLSYEFLSKALAKLDNIKWQLTIIGDGKERAHIEDIFSRFTANDIFWEGEVAPEKIAQTLNKHQLFLWPGFGEAYGLAYLEAQMCGLPVIAQHTHGVPWVVKDGKTGLLVEAGNVEEYARAIDLLSANTNLRNKLGKQARDFVLSKRSLESASKRINEQLRLIL